MLKITLYCDFETIHANSWGQAIVILNEIKKAGKEKALMSYLEYVFPDGAEPIEINDLLSDDWDEVYNYIGMPLD